MRPGLLAPVLLAVLLAACGPPDATDVIRRGVEAHGGDRLDGTRIAFDFREYHYTIEHDGGRYTYTRAREDSTGAIRDILTNDTFRREIDGERVALTQERAAAYTSSLNAVAYFMLLPWKLTDPAVKPRMLSETTIKGEPYYEVEVTFRRDGGGRDYQDRFVYWFHRDRHTMDYLAYDYVTDETGTRFRETIRTHEVGGLRFQDYNNYTSTTINAPGDPIEKFDDEFERGTLELVSVIESTTISVESLHE